MAVHTKALADGSLNRGAAPLPPNPTTPRDAHLAAVLALAGRYDGLDLPDVQCRVTVLDGLPSGAHLQERFLSDTLLAGRVLRARLRTRVIQGAGRCTRGLSDHSVVVVLGDELTRFFGLPEVHDALRPELQAEIDFGLENSSVALADLLGSVRSFLAQDQDWREQAESDLLERRKAATRRVDPEAAELAAAGSHEIKAAAAAWAGEWDVAAAAAQDAAGCIQSAKLSGYRALWLYFAGSWLGEQAAERDDDTIRRASLDLLRKAHAAGRGTGWLRQTHALPSDQLLLDDLDELAVTGAAEHGPRHLSTDKWASLQTRIIDGLTQPNATGCEQALVALGKLLGAESSKPAGDGRTDAAWVWAGQWWLAVEAKSEEGAHAPVSLATVRQANDQLKTLAHDREEPIPEGSAVLVVTPRVLVDPTAAVAAEPFVHMATPDTVLALANDAIRAWRDIRSQGSGLSDEQVGQLIARAFAEHDVLPSDLAVRLLRDPVGG